MARVEKVRFIYKAEVESRARQLHPSSLLYLALIFNHFLRLAWFSALAAAVAFFIFPFFFLLPTSFINPEALKIETGDAFGGATVVLRGRSKILYF